MKRDYSSGTLQLSKPWGITFGLALFILLVYLLLGEALSRSEIVRSTLTSPSMGSTHRQFEEQLSRLQAYAADRQSVDCIVVGDSTVQTDFAPSNFERAYRDQTGEEIDCFNFGVGATNVVSSAVLMRIMAEDYKPRLLIFGIHALDFTVPSEAKDVANLLEMPWMRYRLGEFLPAGWLYEHSYLFRYGRLFSQLLSLRATRESLLRGDQDDLPAGYYPMEGQGPFDMARPPDPASDHPYDEHYFAELGNFELLPANLEALDQIAGLQSDTTEVIAVEMPVSKTYFYYFGNGEEEYRQFLEEITARLSAKSVSFWETTQHISLPDKVWFNRNHLNQDGAVLFSEWFGQQVGEAVRKGTVMLPSGQH